MRSFTLEFPRPTNYLTQNSTRQMHWRRLHAEQKHWKLATMAALQNLRCQGGFFKICSSDLGISRVTSEFSFTTNRNRDGHNYAATMKPIIDQLVKMGVWPDDNTKYVLDSTPILVVDKTRPETVRIHVEEIESARPTSAG